VSEYSQLKLTYESDRLPALSAIVVRMMRFKGTTGYIAGVWTDNLLKDLLGFVSTNRKFRRLGSSIPSWAWPSVGRQFLWYQEQLLETVELVDPKPTPIGPPQLGRVLDATIVLRAPVIKVQVWDLEIPDDYTYVAIQDILPKYKAIRVAAFLREFYRHSR
jgi:hypothetical protein